MKFGEVYNILMKDLVECETEEEIEDIYQYHYKDETEREKMKEIMTLILEYQYNEKLYGQQDLLAWGQPHGGRGQLCLCRQYRPQRAVHVEEQRSL